jgi:RNA polymerase sigma-70 factor (ECF subfamily)
VSSAAVAISQDEVTGPRSSSRPRFDVISEPARSLGGSAELERQAAAPTDVSSAARRISPIGARRFDRKSRAWLDALRSPGRRREEAIGRLYALLLREARFEVRRRTARLAHPSGRDLDDLAVQAADDAVVAILAKLDQFRGDSLFTTWARRFVQHEAPAKIRRRLGRAREVPSEGGFEHGAMWAVDVESPHDRSVAKESAATLARLMADELTPHQREVLVALVLDGVPTEHLATRLDTTTGALYKTLHDARRKLRASFAHA